MTDDGERIVIEWDNSRIPQNPLLRAVGGGSWVVCAALTLVSTWFAVNDHDAGVAFKMSIVFAVIGGVGLLGLPLAWKSEGQIERVELSRQRYRHTRTRTWVPSVDCKVSDISRLRLGNEPKELLMALSVFHGCDVDRLASNASDEFKRRLFIVLTHYISQHDLAIEVIDASSLWEK